MTSDLPELNIPLFRQILKHLEAHPELHDQADFENPYAICGTTRCVAGWALVIDANNKGENITSYRRAESMENGGLAPSRAARKLLGLTPLEGEELFYLVSNEEAVGLVRNYAAGVRSGHAGG